MNGFLVEVCRRGLVGLFLGTVGVLHGALSPYSDWAHGPPADPSYFPIAVWLQNPVHADRYRAAGINLYVGLWKGPTGEQLSQLRKAGMQVVCHQNEVGLSHPDREVIVGWMHGDEPDNAQSLGPGRGYGPPIAPEEIVASYRRMRQRDPTRPVFLNLGQGVAWDDWIGRGVRRGHPEDYPRYIRGCDIVSFDIYPVVHDHPAVSGRLEFVVRGVRRLGRWAAGQKVIWNCIECSRISNPVVKPTADQVRSEVWMSLIEGSRGLIYFVHQFKPEFREASLFEDPELLQGVSRINAQVRRLAPVLNSPSLDGAVEVRSTPDDAPLSCMVKRFEGALYLFAANLRDQPVRGAFRFPGTPVKDLVRVLGEDRTITMDRSGFADAFQGYEVHLYRAEVD